MAKVGGLTKFSFRCSAKLDIGDRLYVCGAIWQLGSFDLQKGIELNTTRETYPVWTTRVPILVTNSKAFIYKYVVRKFENNEFKYVSEFKNLARTALPSGEETTVNDILGSVEEATTSNEQVTKGPEKNKVINGDKAEIEQFKAENKNQTLFLISFHLPVAIKWNPSSESDISKGYWSVSWEPDNIIGKTEPSVADYMDVMWIGAISKVYNHPKKFYDLSQTQREEIKLVIERTLPCKVIILPRPLYEKYYIDLCKKVLKNNFHNIVEYGDYRNAHRDKEKFSTGEWDAMEQTMTDFSALILQEIKNRIVSGKQGFIVWAHDYHLCALPKVVRESWKRIYGSTNSLNSNGGADLKIIFFSHIPFPPYEILISCKHYRNILESLLSADVIGFHIQRHALSFSNCVKKILGIQYRHESGALVIELPHRKVHIAVKKVGIEPLVLDKAFESKEVKVAAKRIAKVYGLKRTESLNGFAGMTQAQYLRAREIKIVFAGIYELQSLRGSLFALKSFELFLEKYPEVRRRAIFLFHGLVRNVNKTSYYRNDDTVDKVKKLIHNINSKYGPHIVATEHFSTVQSLTLTTRMALYKNSQIFVCTPYIEGLNLFPEEYMFTRQKMNDPGVLILTQTAQTALTLANAIKVYPQDERALTKAFHQAFTMSATEKQARVRRNILKAENFTSSAWSRRMIDEANLLPGESISSNFEFDVPDKFRAIKGLDLGVIDNVDCNFMDFQNMYTLKKEYLNSKKRLIVLDYGGTLSKIESNSLHVKREFVGIAHTKLKNNARDVIRELCKNPNNIVFINSGFSREQLSIFLADLLNDPHVRLGIIADSGFSLRWGNLFLTERKKLQPVSQLNKDRHGFVSTGPKLVFPEEIFAAFSNASRICPGSHIISNSSFIRLDYRNVDADIADECAKQLVQDVEAILEKNYLSRTFEMSNWRNSVQFNPKNVSKATGLRHVMKVLKQIDILKDVELGLCIGDDIEDEAMFVELFSQFEILTHDTQQNRTIYTVAVGRKHTCAMYFVNNVDETIALLKTLTT